MPAPEAPPAPAGTFEGIPTIRRRAGDSAGPLVLFGLQWNIGNTDHNSRRARGKVVIITGRPIIEKIIIDVSSIILI
jgi:hypothetical protein